MFVGICTLELHIFSVNSLKEKRQVVKSVVERLRQRYNISIAEIGDNDKWQKCTVGFSCVSNSKKIVNDTINKVIGFVDNDERVEITNIEMEMW